MATRPLTDLGLAMLNSLPPKVRNSIDYQAVIHGAAREVALLEASIETVRAQFNPASADVLLNAWEAMLKLPVGGPAGATTADRRTLVQNRLRKLVTTGEGSQWEEAITELVGPGWSYVEHTADPLINQATDPNFEYDTVGAAPAGYGAFINCSPVATNAWADQGNNSLHTAVSFAAGTLATAQALVLGPTAQILPMPAGAIPITAGQKVAMRRRTKINSLVTVAGVSWRLNWYYDWWNAAHSNIASAVTSAVVLAAGDVGTVKDVQAIVTAPANAAYVTARIGADVTGTGATAQSLDVYDDSVAVYVNPPGGVMPAYVDGDQPGYHWSGAAGNSTSVQTSPGEDGVVDVTLPFPPGSAEFLSAQTQIRDITDAHIELVFSSSAIFRLDTDPMDATQFGA